MSIENENDFQIYPKQGYRSQDDEACHAGIRSGINALKQSHSGYKIMIVAYSRIWKMRIPDPWLEEEKREE